MFIRQHSVYQKLFIIKYPAAKLSSRFLWEFIIILMLENWIDLWHSIMIIFIIIIIIEWCFWAESRQGQSNLTHIIWQWTLNTNTIFSPIYSINRIYVFNIIITNCKWIDDDISDFGKSKRKSIANENIQFRYKICVNCMFLLSMDHWIFQLIVIFRWCSCIIS